MSETRNQKTEARSQKAELIADCGILRSAESQMPATYRGDQTENGGEKTEARGFYPQL